MGFNPERPHYDFDLDLIHADLARMHLNRRDSVSVLSALVEARASGRTLDDLNGKVTVGDVVYRYNADTLRTTRLTLDGQNSAGSKYLSLQSEFADATFRSRTDYKTVFEYLRSSLEKYIPLLYDERKARKRAAGAVSVVDDYSVLSVDVKHFTPVARRGGRRPCKSPTDRSCGCCSIPPTTNCRSKRLRSTSNASGCSPRG